MSHSEWDSKGGLVKLFQYLSKICSTHTFGVDAYLMFLLTKTMTGLALQRAVYKILDCFVSAAQAPDLDLKIAHL